MIVRVGRYRRVKWCGGGGGGREGEVGSLA